MSRLGLKDLLLALVVVAKLRIAEIAGIPKVTNCVQTMGDAIKLPKLVGKDTFKFGNAVTKQAQVL